MFADCPNLKMLDVSNFITNNVTDMSYMFDYCKELTTLDVASFDTRNVTNMMNMFHYCESLKALNVSKFNTSKVTSMESMFSNCKNVEVLDVSDFDTENVTNMRSMFASCYTLQSLDLSSFNTKKAERHLDSFLFFCNIRNVSLPEDYSEILKRTTPINCYYLTTIYVPIDQYEACKNDPNAEGRTVLPYIKVAPQNEYGTICVPMGSKLEAGTFSGFDKLYSPTLNAGKVTLNEVLQITPGAAYVYQQGGKSQSTKKYAAENKSTTPVKNAITFTSDGSTLENTPTTGNIMQGTYEEGTVPVGCYVMQPDGTFTKVTDGNTPIGAYCAYLTEVSQEETIEPTYITTGIEEITLGNNKQAHIYDLTGRRISHPQKGSLYIQNGKKVIF